MSSKALEVNLAVSRVDVSISEKYNILLEAMSGYRGVMDGLNAFLTELCHPLRNWTFIIKEARRYALDYFHLLKTHPNGPDAVRVYIDIFLEAIDSSKENDVRRDAGDNLILFLQKIIRESSEDLSRFLPAVNYGLRRVNHYENGIFFLFVEGYYQIAGLARSYYENASLGSDFGDINLLLKKYLKNSYEYWLKQDDPLEWFIKEAGTTLNHTRAVGEIFQPVSHSRLRGYQKQLESACGEPDLSSKTILNQLLTLPGFRQIVNIYEDIPKNLFKIGEKKGEGNHWKLIFLFHIMEISGLSSIHEEALRDINRTSTWLIGNEETREIQQTIQKTFAILSASFRAYPNTALHCILNMGKAVYQTDDSDLVEFFINAVVDLGFQAPDLKGVGEDWQIRANPAHILNIRTWLELIEQHPKWSKKLLSSFIIHLSIGGVVIKDTDLFPRDITGLLNSDIGAVYNPVSYTHLTLPTTPYV